MVEDVVFAPDAYVQDWLDMNAVRSIWNAHLRGTGQMESMMWGVLVLEHWARNFLPSGGRSPGAMPTALGGHASTRPVRTFPNTNEEALMTMTPSPGHAPRGDKP
jgi:hypothetical protein